MITDEHVERVAPRVVRTHYAWRQTGGRFDITVLPALVQAGYTHSAVSNTAAPAVPGNRVGMSAWVGVDYDASTLTVPPMSAIDLGGIGVVALTDVGPGNIIVEYEYGLDAPPSLLREALEASFKQEVTGLKYLVCTTTLAQGINLPARSVFINTPKRGRGENLDPALLWNFNCVSSTLRVVRSKSRTSSKASRCAMRRDNAG
mgnify:CR=1 FL=1